MPPEPLPWDRRRQQHQERSLSSSSSDPPFLGDGGGGPGPRWRGPYPMYHHNNNHGYNHHHYGPNRWASDFRTRPPGHGKQGGGWHMYPEEPSRGFVPSRSSEKILEDENFRPSGSRGDFRYSRSSSRENNRGSFSQKDWRVHTWEAVSSPSGPGRPSETNNQRSISVDNQKSVSMDNQRSVSVENLPASNAPSSHPDHDNPINESNSKDHLEEKGGIGRPGGSGISANTGNPCGAGNQKIERQTSLGSTDWKPLKWTRTGSLSSRGSGFSHSSSSKSMGIDSGETKAEAQPQTVTPLQSPSGDAAACVTSAAPVLPEEAGSRKKPRLGWGEGLAKFEKKKVECPDESASKNVGVTCGSNSLLGHSNVLNVVDKSPRVQGIHECASPATPSSVACSSSPGIEEKHSSKTVNADHDTVNLSGSLAIVSQNNCEESSFNLENLEVTPIARLSSSIDDLLHSDELSALDSGFVRSSAMNKLLLWKVDILKAVEKTESEIDSLENELKSLLPENGNSPHPAASSSLPTECHSEPCADLCSPANVTSRPAPLDLVSSGDMILEKPHDAQEHGSAAAKDDDIDSPGTATSKFVEMPSVEKDDSAPDTMHQHTEGFAGQEKSSGLEVECCMHDVSEEKTADSSICADDCQLIVSSPPSRSSDGSININRECDLILAANKDCAKTASEVFSKLLPNARYPEILGTATATCLQSDSIIKEKFLARRRSMRLKERIIALKYKASLHLWREDIRSLSMKKLRAKSHKKSDPSLRTLQSGYQKYRTSLRCRVPSAGIGSLCPLPTTDIVDLVSRLISDSQSKPCTDTLKMPAMILDPKEKMISRFISNNGLVEDPLTAEKERSLINPWTSEEKEIFINKLATFGKDFRKIASFLDHKTTADCVEFYYKNHKSDCFDKTKKKPDFAKQGKSYSTNTYLVAAGKRRNREANAASLDVLGAASVIASKVNDSAAIQQKSSSKYYLGGSVDDESVLERSNSFDIYNSERETVAADVLAGICGSISSEAMSSCITSSVDPGESYPDWKCQRPGSSTRRPLTPEVTQSVDDETCSDESCGEMDPADWTDEEKAIFIHAVSSYGRDFAMISRCVITRSREQCKIFFSKARKCLGLDSLHPRIGEPVGDDANGGRSDTEDAGVVETCSDIHSEKSKSKHKMGDDMVSDIKLNHAYDMAGAMNIKPDLNKSEEMNKIENQVSLETEPLSKNLVLQPCPMEDDVVQPSSDGDSSMRNGASAESVAMQDHEDVVSSALKAEGNVGTDDCGQANKSGGGNGLEASAECTMTAPKGQGEPFCQRSANEKEVESKDATSKIGFKCSKLEKVSESESPRDTSHTDSVARVSHSSLPGYQQKNVVEAEDAKKPDIISLQPNNTVLSTDSASHDTLGTKTKSAVDCGTSPVLNLEKNNDALGQKGSHVGDRQQNPSSCLLENGKASQILKGLPMSSSKEMGARSGSLHSLPNSERSFHSDKYSGLASYLQKCNSLKEHASVAELSLPSQERQMGDVPSTSSGSSDVEKPCGNGDVKLFGQILSKPSSKQKSNSSMQQNGDKGDQQSKVSSNSFNLKFAGGQTAEGNSNPARFDHSTSMRSFGFWDGNRIQTGFPSLPDSTMLLARYPAAFGNFAVPSTKLEQLPLHGVVKNGDRNLNGLPVFPAKEMNGGNGVSEYHQVYRNREMQPFTIDMKQRQDALFSEMQRRNGFDVIPNVQQPPRGLVGMNPGGRGGVLVSSQCTGVSDPVAAIKMHYAQAEQLGVQAGAIIREDDSWRGKGGDIGR